MRKCSSAGQGSCATATARQMRPNSPTAATPLSHRFTSQACRRRSECGGVTYVGYTYRCYLKPQSATWNRVEQAGVQTIVVTNCPSPPPPPRCGWLWVLGAAGTRCSVSVCDCGAS